MKEQPQPKFWFGQKVTTNNSNYYFTVNSIWMNSAGGFTYGSDRDVKHWDERDLTEVKEPLTAEFECEWKCEPDAGYLPEEFQEKNDGHSFNGSQRLANILSKFEGKPTTVIIKEKL